MKNFIKNVGIYVFYRQLYLLLSFLVCQSCCELIVKESKIDPFTLLLDNQRIMMAKIDYIFDKLGTIDKAESKLASITVEVSTSLTSLRKVNENVEILTENVRDFSEKLDTFTNQSKVDSSISRQNYHKDTKSKNPCNEMIHIFKNGAQDVLTCSSMLSQYLESKNYTKKNTREASHHTITAPLDENTFSLEGEDNLELNRSRSGNSSSYSPTPESVASQFNKLIEKKMRPTNDQLVRAISLLHNIEYRQHVSAITQNRRLNALLNKLSFHQHALETRLTNSLERDFKDTREILREELTDFKEYFNNKETFHINSLVSLATNISRSLKHIDALYSNQNLNFTKMDGKTDTFLTSNYLNSQENGNDITDNMITVMPIAEDIYPTIAENLSAMLNDSSELGSTVPSSIFSEDTTTSGPVILFASTSSKNDIENTEKDLETTTEVLEPSKETIGSALSNFDHENMSSANSKISSDPPPPSEVYIEEGLYTDKNLTNESSSFNEFKHLESSLKEFLSKVIENEVLKTEGTIKRGMKEAEEVLMGLRIHQTSSLYSQTKEIRYEIEKLSLGIRETVHEIGEKLWKKVDGSREALLTFIDAAVTSVSSAAVASAQSVSVVVASELQSALKGIQGKLSQVNGKRELIGCPKMYQSIGNQCFLVLNMIKTTWQQGCKLCKSLGGDLAYIPKKSEMATLKEVLRMNNEDEVWIRNSDNLEGDMSCDLRSNEHEEELTNSVANPPIHKLHFQEASNGKGVMCNALNFHTMELRNESCINTLGVICQHKVPVFILTKHIYKSSN